MFRRLIFVAFFWSCASGAADNDADLIRARMAKLFPGEAVTSIKAAQISGLYEVMLGASLFYMSSDGRYVVHGDLIDLENQVNLSAQRRAAARKAVFSNLVSGDLIEFPASGGQTREVLYVYTDIDCGYCRKMHLEVPRLNTAGIAVRYLAFPRSGLKGESFDKAAAVWCAADRRQALTDAKAGKKISSPPCVNPVAEHYALGQAMGVTGTPAVYTADGKQLGGYVPAERLIEHFQ